MDKGMSRASGWGGAGGDQTEKAIKV